MSAGNAYSTRIPVVRTMARGAATWNRTRAEEAGPGGNNLAAQDQPEQPARIAVPRFYMYMFLALFFLAEMTITGWSLLYWSMAELPFRSFYINTVVSAPVVGALTLATYYIVRRAVSRTFVVQEALRENEGFLKGITDIAKDGILVVDAAGRIRFSNPACEATFGYSADSLLGKDIRFLVTGPCLARGEGKANPLVESIKSEEGMTVEMSGLRSDGTEFPIEVSITSAPIEGKLSTEVMIRDITERVAAEAALKESERKYHGLFNSSRDGIVMTDSRGTVMDCNNAALEMLGYEADEIEGKNYIQLVSEAERDTFREAIKELEDKGYTDLFDTAGRRKDGTTFPQSVRCWLVRGELDEPIGRWATVRDMTQQREAQGLIEKQAEELRNLIEVAGHELRHPATIFKGYSYLLLERGADLGPEEFKDALNCMDEAANRVTHLVNDLLDTSRIERGNLNLAYKEIFPYMLIKRAVEEMTVRGCDRDYILSILSDDDCLMNVDPEKIKQVLSILLDNADKYSPARTNVEIWHERRGDEAVFHVADRGPGVPEGRREMVFERFYQGEEVIHHSTPGLGLGLYIARRIIDAHGGWITVKPREGGGSDFCFGVPATGIPSSTGLKQTLPWMREPAQVQLSA